jgi:RNA polymerase sigma-70 factor (ECF subfamily)
MDSATVPDEAFLARLRHAVRRMTRSEHDAEDIVQDALVKLLKQGGGVPASSLRAWLFTVARREVVDRVRRRRRAAPLTADVEAPTAREESAIPSLARCVGPMLGALAPREREILDRVDVRGESQSAIARAAAVPLSTVKSQVQRARGRLRARFDACCEIERDRRGKPIAHRARSGAPCVCPAPSGAA